MKDPFHLLVPSENTEWSSIVLWLHKYFMLAILWGRNFSLFLCIHREELSLWNYVNKLDLRMSICTWFRWLGCELQLRLEWDKLLWTLRWGGVYFTTGRENYDKRRTWRFLSSGIHVLFNLLLTMYRPWGYDEAKNHEILSLLDCIILYCSLAVSRRIQKAGDQFFLVQKKENYYVMNWMGISQQPSVGGPYLLTVIPSRQL